MGGHPAPPHPFILQIRVYSMLSHCNSNLLFSCHLGQLKFTSQEGGGGGGVKNSTLIRRVCATGILHLPSCSGVENPKCIPCSGTKNVSHISCSRVTTPSSKQTYVLYCIVLYCIVLYCIVLYCIVLYCIGDKDHIYALLI